MVPLTPLQFLNLKFTDISCSVWEGPIKHNYNSMYARIKCGYNKYKKATTKEIWSIFIHIKYKRIHMNTGIH